MRRTPLRRAPMRLIAGCLATAALLLTGCGSLARLAYDNVDWLLLERMDTYADFTPQQRDRVEGELVALHGRHRDEELPRIAAWLRGVRAAIASGPSREAADALAREARGGLERHAALLAPVVARALVRLDEAQIAHLEGAFADKREEIADEFVQTDLREYRASRAKRSVGRLRDWLGYLTDSQLDLVRARVLAMPATGHDWLAYHRKEQVALVSALRRSDGEEAILARLEAWWIDLERLKPAAKLRSARLREHWKSLLVDLGATLEPAQRESALGRVDGYIEAVESLMEAEAA